MEGQLTVMNRQYLVGSFSTFGVLEFWSSGVLEFGFFGGWEYGVWGSGTGLGLHLEFGKLPLNPFDMTPMTSINRFLSNNKARRPYQQGGVRGGTLLSTTTMFPRTINQA